MIGNAKTMFKVMNEFKRVEKPKQNLSTNNIANIKQEETIVENNYTSTDEGPTFFI